MRRLLRGMLAFALMSASAFAAGTGSTVVPLSAGDDRSQAQELVFLLQYVGSDYAGSVQGGRIVDEAEYRENKEFTAAIAERFARLRSGIPEMKAQALEDAVRTLDRLVAARADARVVKEVTESAIPIVVEAFGLRAYPRERPDPERARRLYADNCALCHGPRGNGDGDRARELDPPPARFTDTERMTTAAPYVFYNAIMLGVANTAMASFGDSLSDQERWDLAFFLWTFALPEAERAQSPPPVVLTLRDLATRSATDLAPEVIRQAAARGRTIDVPEASIWIAALRANPPNMKNPQDELARLRRDLNEAIALVDRGAVDSAADLVTDAYLQEFEPLEPELDRRDGRVRQSFERGLIDFRAALRRADRERALVIAHDLERTVDRAAEVLAGSPPSAGNRSLALLAVLAVAALGGMLVIRWIGKARGSG